MSYTYDGNLRPVSVTTAAGDGSLSRTATLAYDALGDVASVTMPMGSANTPTTTVFLYDAARQNTGIIGPAPTGDGHYRAARFTYNADGHVTLQEVGYTTSQSDTTLANFVSMQQTATAYDSVGRAIQTAYQGNNVVSGVADYSYDAANRLSCAVVRMNASAFGALPGSACTLGPAGPNGQDRITQYTYDAANELTQVVEGYGTAAPVADTTVAAYTGDGRPVSVKDGNGNLTSYTYDGFDRLSQTNYPTPSNGGASNSADYEGYGYDAASNMLTRRLRDGNVISMGYDALNRMASKAVSGANPTYITYDLLNRPTMYAFSAGGAMDALSYDALGRVTGETTNNVPMAYAYDLAGDLTQLTYFDGMVIDYAYDTGGELTTVQSPQATGAAALLASYTYDDLGRRVGVARGSGTTTAYGYDGVSRLASLSHSLSTTNPIGNQAYSLGYTPSSQINALSQSNGLYQWAPSYGAPSFDGEFGSLSLWNGTTGAGSTGVWATNYGYGGNSDSVTARTLPGTGEVELYVDPSLTGTGTTALGLNPYSLSGGVLTLHAAPTPPADVASLWGYNFTSGMISSRNTFTQTYGYFEAEMKLPPGQGNWPAFWLYAVNGNSELDVMEEQNGSNVIKGTAHNNGSGGDATYVTNTIPNLTAGFHKFGVLWTPTTITWYVDRVAIGSVPTPSNLNSPMYMIANLALNSSTPSNYAGGALEIGYIRAYTLANAPVSNQSLAYGVNGLNQLTTSGAGAATSYDTRGNLTFDGVNTYAYDTLNQLSTVDGATTLGYDARNRLISLSVPGAATTQFVYAGDQLAAEVQVTGSTSTIVGRYVPGVGEDQPLTMYTGATLSSPYELLEDHAGSIIAANSATGGGLYVNTYSDYGVPGSGNFGRYQYTGQVSLPEVGLYTYKARMYSASLGRFMQTDPIGYGDGLNWYRYVHGDPVNGSDPSGMDPPSLTFDPANNTYAVGEFTGYGSLSGGGGFDSAGGGSGGGSVSGIGGAYNFGANSPANTVQEVVVHKRRQRMTAQCPRTGTAGPITNFIGFAFSAYAYIAGKIAGTNPKLQNTPNGVRVTNSPVNFGNRAVSIGNFEVFTPGQTPSGGQISYTGAFVNNGRHEDGHTYQATALGDLYLPAEAVLSGLGNNNPLEADADQHALSSCP